MQKKAGNTEDLVDAWPVRFIRREDAGNREPANATKKQQQTEGKQQKKPKEQQQTEGKAEEQAQGSGGESADRGYGFSGGWRGFAIDQVRRGPASGAAGGECQADHSTKKVIEPDLCSASEATTKAGHTCSLSDVWSRMHPRWCGCGAMTMASALRSLRARQGTNCTMPQVF